MLIRTQRSDRGSKCPAPKKLSFSTSVQDSQATLAYPSTSRACPLPSQSPGLSPIPNRLSMYAENVNEEDEGENETQTNEHSDPATTIVTVTTADDSSVEQQPRSVSSAAVMKPAQSPEPPTTPPPASSSSSLTPKVFVAGRIPSKHRKLLLSLESDGQLQLMHGTGLHDRPIAS